EQQRNQRGRGGGSLHRRDRQSLRSRHAPASSVAHRAPPQRHRPMAHRPPSKAIRATTRRESPAQKVAALEELPRGGPEGEPDRTLQGPAVFLPRQISTSNQVQVPPPSGAMLHSLASTLTSNKPRPDSSY